MGKLTGSMNEGGGFNAMEKMRYYSFILRVWMARDGGQPQWRASLENTGTGERRGFASLEDLYRYLKVQTGQEAGDQGRGGASP